MKTYAPCKLLGIVSVVASTLLCAAGAKPSNEAASIYGEQLPGAIAGVSYLLHSPPIPSNHAEEATQSGIVLGYTMLPFDMLTAFNLSKATADKRLVASDQANTSTTNAIVFEQAYFSRSQHSPGMDMDLHIRFNSSKHSPPGFAPYDAAVTMAIGSSPPQCAGGALAPRFQATAANHLQRLQLSSTPTTVTQHNATAQGTPLDHLNSTSAPFNASVQLSVRVQWLSPQLAPHVSCELYAVTTVGTWQRLRAPCVGAVHGHPLPGDGGSHLNGSWAPGLAWRPQQAVRVRVHLFGEALGNVPLLRDSLVLNCTVGTSVVGVRGGAAHGQVDGGVPPWQLMPGAGISVPLADSSVLLGVAAMDVHVESSVLCSWSLGVHDSQITCSGGQRLTDAFGASAEATLQGMVHMQCTGHFCCTLFQGGSVRCTGTDEEARTGAPREGPGQMTSALDFGQPAVQVRVGYNHACTLLLDGAVKCWGLEPEHLGLGAATGSTPEIVAPLSHIAVPGQYGVRSVSAGNDYTCAIFNHSCVKCWGLDAIGKLGNGDVGALRIGGDAATAPAVLPCIGLPNQHRYIQVAAGADFTCALTAAGSVLCWGLPFPASMAAVAPLPLSVPAHKLVTSSGANVMCALLVDTSIRCFGSSSSLEVYLELSPAVETAAGSDAFELARVAPSLGGQAATDVWLSESSICTVSAAGVQCWSSISSLLSPPGVPGTTPSSMRLPEDVRDGLLSHHASGPMDMIHASAYALQPGRSAHIALTPAGGCALDDMSGRLSCWGELASRVGTSSITTGTSRRLAAANGATIPFPSPVVAIFSGSASVLIGLQSGEVYALRMQGGTNLPGYVGAEIGITERLVLHGRNMVSAASTKTHACVCFKSGQVQCWGSSSNGRLGYGDLKDVADGIKLTLSDPSFVSLSGPAVHIALGEQHSCALLASGESQCWGSNVDGQLGRTGDTNNVGDTPSRIPSAVGPSHELPLAVDLTAGSLWTAVLTAEGSVFKTGTGTGDTLESAAPCVALAAARATLCTIDVLGAVRCSLEAGEEDPVGLAEADPPLPFAGPVQQIALQEIVLQAGPPISSPTVCAVLLSGATQCLSLSSVIGVYDLRMGYPADSSLERLPPQLAMQHMAQAPSRYMILPQPDGVSLRTLSVMTTPAHLRGGGVAGIPHTTGGAVQDVRLLPLWLIELHSSMHIERVSFRADLRVPCVEAGASIAAQTLPPALHTLYAAPAVDVVQGTRSATQACSWPRGTFDNSGGIFIDSVQLAGSPAGSAVQLSPVGGQTLALSGSYWTLLLLHRGDVDITVDNMPCMGALSLRATVHELNCVTTPLNASSKLPPGTVGLPVRLYHSFSGQTSPVLSPVNVTFSKPTVQSVLAFVTAGGSRRQLTSAGTGVLGGNVTVQGSNLGPTAAESQDAGIMSLTQVLVHDAASSGSVVGSCAVFASSFEAVNCTMPPYTGQVHLSAVLAGGLSSTTRAAFSYAKPVISTVTPAVLFHDANSTTNATVHVYGSNLGHSRSAILGITVAGVACPTVTWVTSSHLQCDHMRVSELPQDSAKLPTGVQVSFSVNQSPVSGAVEVVGQPALSSAQITAGASAGQGASFLSQQGGTLRLLGAGLAAASPGATTGVQVTVGRQPCAVQSLRASELTCTVGPGMGPVANVVFVRGDGAHAVLQETPLQYEVPLVEGLSPAVLLPVGMQALSHAPTLMNITVSGTAFGQSARLVSVSVLKASTWHSCASVQWLSSSQIFCVGLPVTALSPGDRFKGSTIQVDFHGVPASTLSSASLEVLPLPEVSSVQPAAVGAGGGVQVQLYGAGLGTSAADIVNVTIGDALCTNVNWVSAERLWCTAPSLAAAGMSPAPVAVATVGGYQSSSEEATLAYRTPQIFSVDPVERLLAVASDPASLANLTVFGSELGGLGQEAAASMTIGGVDCIAAHGRIVLPSTAGSSIRCEGFQQAALPQPSGVSDAVDVLVTTPSGITVAQVGGALILKRPEISRVDPSAAAAGSPVVILGGAFGWRAGDVQAVFVGPQEIPTASWQWSQSSITIVSLLAPLAGSVRGLTVQVQLRSGLVAQATDAFSYLAAPQAPVLAPVQLCAFRDQLGTVQAVFVWEGSAVAAWAVHSSGPFPPWHASAGQQATAVALLDATLAQRAQAFNTSARLQVYCPHVWEYLQAHTTAGWHQVQVLTAASGTAQWLRVAATESRSNRALDGPLSAFAGPVLPACLSVVGSEQYLSTQFAASGQWGDVACRSCPSGAVCRGRPFEALVNAAGTFRAGWDASGLTFVPCPRPASCSQRASPVLRAGDLPYLVSDDPSVQVHISTLQPDDVLQQAQSGVPDDALAPTPAGQAVCPEGYAGRLCAQCDSGYSRAGGRTCSKCASLGLVWFTLLASVLLGIAGMVFLTMTTIRSKGEPKKAHVALSKLLFSHMQTIGIAAAFPFQWPDPLSGLFAVLDAGSSVGTALVSVDCLGFDSSAFRASAATQLLLPLILLSLVTALWGARGLLWPRADSVEEVAAVAPATPTTVLQNPMRAQSPTRIKEAKPSKAKLVPPKVRLSACAFCVVDVSPWTGWIVSVLVVSFVLHLSLVKTALSVMTCEEVAGKRFLVGDYDVDCEDPANASWIYGMGMSGLLLYGAGIPLGSFLVVWRRKARLNDANIRRKFGFLYVTYKPQAWYWEMAILMRKVGLAVIAVLMQPLGAGLQSTCALVLLASSLLIHERVAPFQDSMLNKLESSSLFVALVTIAGGAALLDESVGLASKQFVTVMLLLCNAVFVFVVVFILVRGAALQGDNRVALQRLLQRSGMRPQSVRLLLGAPVDKTNSPSPSSDADEEPQLPK